METAPLSPTPYDRLIEPVLSDFKPASPLWPAGTRLAVWLLLQLGIVVLAVAGGRRPNVLEKLNDREFVAGVAGMAAIGIAAAALAFKSAIPGETEMTGRKFITLATLAAGAAFLLVYEPTHAAVPLHQFLADGTYCMACTFLLAATPWLALFWAVRRAMPLWGAAEGALIGISAFAFSFAATRLGCPLDDFSHVLVWHALPAAIGAAASIWVGALWLQDRWLTQITD